MVGSPPTYQLFLVNMTKPIDQQYFDLFIVFLFLFADLCMKKKQNDCR